LRQVAAHTHAMTFGQPLLGDHRGGHAHGGFARRGAAAATRVADAVLLPVGVVGMAGAEGRGYVAVVLAALVGVADQERDRRACGPALVHPRQDLHLVRLAALRGMARLAGGATVEVVAEFLRAYRQPRRAAVDHA